MIKQGESRPDIDWILRNAMSIESKPIENGPVETIGEKRSGNRVYVFYRDAKSCYWYENKFETQSGRISEFEYIFGRKTKREGKQ